MGSSTGLIHKLSIGPTLVNLKSSLMVETPGEIELLAINELVQDTSALTPAVM